MEVLVTEYPTVETRIAMLDVENASDPLLDLICDKLILPYFPHDDRDERDAIGTFLALNDENRWRKIQYRVIAALRGNALVGTTIFTFFGCDGFCFMNGQYTSVMPSERGRGLAKALSYHREKAAQEMARRFGYRDLDFTIITLANPQNGSARPDMSQSPNHKVLQAIWLRWGHDLIDFPYIQLPLADGKAPLSNVLLGIKRYSDRYKARDYLTAGEMRRILEACNHFRFSQKPNEQYPQYIAMLNLLECRPQTRIIV
jgi:GNAT superfamily N-acetyltransferase